MRLGEGGSYEAAVFGGGELNAVPKYYSEVQPRVPFRIEALVSSGGA